MDIIHVLLPFVTVHNFIVIEEAVIAADKMDLPEFVLPGHGTKMGNANIISKFELYRI